MTQETAQETVLVTGATGQVARQVVAGVRAAGQRVRALTRDAGRARALLGDGVEVVEGAWGDPGVLERAVAGVDRIFLGVGTAPDQDRLENAVVDAAAAAGNAHVVKLSTIGADLPPEQLADYQVARWHAAVEAHLRASGLPATVLRPNAFMTNLLAFAPTIASQGAIHTSTGTGRVSMVDPADVAAVAVTALTQPGHAGASYLITGPESLSYADVAAVFTRALGRAVRFVEVDDVAVEAALTALGMPAWLVSVYAEGNVKIRANAFAEVAPDVVQALTGRPRRSLAQWVAGAAAAFGPTGTTHG